MQKIVDAEWAADPNQPGRITVGDAVDVQVKVAFWRVPGGDSEAMRLVKEAEALCLAAPAMAKALSALRDRLTEAGRALPTTRTAEELASMDTSITIPAPLLKAALEALAKAGFP